MTHAMANHAAVDELGFINWENLEDFWQGRPEVQAYEEGHRLNGGVDHQVHVPEELIQPDVPVWEELEVVEGHLSDDWNFGDGTLLEGSRLRSRGKTSCQAWACLLGILRNDGGFLCSVVDGPPEHMISRYVKGIWGDAAKLRGVQRVSLGEDEDDFLLKIVTPGVEGDRWISVRVFASLLTWVLFKERTMELLAGLRSRAIQEARNLRYPWVTFASVAPDTIAAAFMVTSREKQAWDRISGVCGHDTLEYSARYSRGEIDPGLWRSLCYGISRACQSLPGPHALNFKVK